jgi:hypothetical protein
VTSRVDSEQKANISETSVCIEKGTLTYAPNWHGWWFEKVLSFLVTVKLQILKYIADTYVKIGKKEHFIFEIVFVNIKHFSKCFIPSISF